MGAKHHSRAVHGVPPTAGRSSATVTKPTSSRRTIFTLLDRLRTFAGTRLALRLTLGLFIVQATILAFVTQVGTPPDETNHIDFIQYYAQHTLAPIFSHQQPTYNLGDKTREVDYLYHYSMSLLYRVLPFSAHGKILAIRLLSVFFGVLCLLALIAVFRRLKVPAAVVTTGLLITTNLPMVLMMCAAVNNDVLVWLGMALGMLLLLRLWERPALTDALWLLLLAIVGGLVKRDLLPVGLVFGLMLVVIVIKNGRMLLGQLKRPSLYIAVLGLLVLLGGGLFVERVGGNIVRYGHIVPSCEEVQSVSACYDFWGNVRIRALAQLPPENQLPPPVYVAHWIYDSAANVVDIQTQGWRHQVRPGHLVVPLLLWLLGIGLSYGLWHDLRRWRTEQAARHRLYLVLIVLSYIGVQLAVNWVTYQHYRRYGIALNGRYVIAALLPLAVFTCWYWTLLLRRYPRVLAMLALTVVATTIGGSGLLLMLHNPQLYKG